MKPVQPITLRYAAPDADGHFGPYGGAFIPEILVPTFDALRAAWDEAQHDPAFWAEWREAAGRIRRPPDAAHPRRTVVRADGPEGLPQARGPLPHGRAQGQQHRRADPARAPHGPHPHHRRDRRRAARRGHGHGLRAIRAAVRRLHGRGGHGRQHLNVLRMRLLGAEVRPALSSGSQPSRTPPTRPSATGWPTPTTRST